MTKGIQLWPGDRMRAFYRRMIVRETALDSASTEKLTEALTKATNRMLVWEMPEDAATPAKVADKKAADTSTAGKAASKSKGSKGDTGGGKPAKPAPLKDAAPPEKPFDPYAFSAMVVLTKQGREGLAAQLAEINSVENLKRFADAQHLGFDRSLTKIEDVRKALLAAAEQRLADRRAAAS